MPAPSGVDNYFVVAERLLDDLDEDEDPDFAAEWAACENSRARSAVSRGYYAAFLKLKYLLQPHMQRAGTAFPKQGVHGKVRGSIAAIRKSVLANKIRDLSDARARADYDWSGEFGAEVARDFLIDADDVMADIDRLTPLEIARIADELIKRPDR